MIGVFAPQVVLYGVGAVLTGLLQAAGRFAWPAFAPVLSSLVVMAGYLGYASVVGDEAATMTGSALPGRAFVALAWGTTAGVAAMTLPLLIPLYRNGFRLRPGLRMPPGTGSRVLRLAGSGVLAVLAQQAFLLAVVWLANYRGAAGTLVAFGYTQALIVLPFAVLVAPLVTALFPRLARAANAGAGAFPPLAARALRSVLLAGTAGAVLLASTAPAVAALFDVLDRGDVGPMASALLAAAPGLVGFAVVVLVGRALYALEAPGAAAAGTSVAWLAAIVLAAAGVLTASPERALLALSAGQSVAMVIGALVMLGVLRRRQGSGALTGLFRTAAVVLPAGLVAVAAGWSVARWLGGTWPVGVLASLTAAGAAAVVAMLVFAVPVAGVAADLAAGTGDRDDGSEDVAGGVLLVLGPSGGGIGRHVRSLALGLHARGHGVAVAAPPATLRAFGYAEHGLATWQLAIGDRPHPLRDLAAVRRLRRLGRRAAVVHAHGLRAGALSVLACRRSQVPVVVTVHNALVTGDAPTPGPAWQVAALVHRLLERVVARGAAHVLVVSADLGERMRALGASGVDRALVPAPVRAAAGGEAVGAVRARVRSDLDVPDGTALLVTVARLAPQKGLEVLLDAVTELVAPPSRPLRCVIAGDGPLHDELAAAVAARGLPVHLLGRRDDVPDLLQAADLVVVPSLWEGQPLVVQEALRVGAAIVATNTGGTAEVTGEAAWLVPPRRPGELAGAIRGLLADPDGAARLRRIAARRAELLPTDTQALDQVLTLYRRLAADRLESRGAAHA